jgi:hypothetical protein
MKNLLVALLLLIAANAQAQTHQRISGDTARTTGASAAKNDLREVTVSASRQKLREHVAGTQMGRVDIPVALLLKTPAIGGEPDIIKALQLTPGVKRGTEGGIGMYVRGGGKDENLVLMDGAPVYNAGHLLGFFSVFNAASLKDAQLYKSSFPAQYGGRLSSVLDVRTKEGSLTDYRASASIGLISSSISLQGPIIKDKLSAIVSARRTYIDKVFKYIPYHFYDVNAKLTYVANSNNRFYLSSYKGDDLLRMSGASGKPDDSSLQSGMKLGNTTGTLRWNNTRKDGRLVSDISFLYTRFGYDISGSLGANTLSMRSAIRDFGIKGDHKWYTGGPHKLSAGFSLTNHFFNPNIVQSAGSSLDQFKNSDGKKIYSNEAAVYVNDDYRINSRWQLSAGLRLSGNAVAGKTYVTPEPRLAARYLIDDRNSIKGSYARMAQYMHLVSSSSLTMPTDLWYPVTARIQPGISDQVSAGYYHSIPDCNITLSVEGYYKYMQHLVEYREGAQLMLNDNYEQELVNGAGRSYGVEFFASKTSGRFTGWLGYSLSYAHRTFDSLNGGREYYARYDRRHDFSVVGMYDLNSRWSVSSNIVYSTGSPFTGQTSQYLVPKPDFTGVETLPAYTGRNELRMSACFRVDLDVQYKFALGKRLKGDAHLSMYNAMNRTQPGQVQRVWDEQKQTYTYQQKGLFGNITTASINFNL